MRHRTVTVLVPQADGSTIPHRLTATDDPYGLAGVICQAADEHPGADISVTVRTDYENELPPHLAGGIGSLAHAASSQTAPSAAAPSSSTPNGAGS